VRPIGYLHPLALPEAAVTLLTYLWHYTVARLLYDDVLRPLGPAALALPALACGVALARRRRRR
jgi:hypothetical protein